MAVQSDRHRGHLRLLRRLCHHLLQSLFSTSALVDIVSRNTKAVRVARDVPTTPCVPGRVRVLEHGNGGRS